MKNIYLCLLVFLFVLKIVKSKTGIFPPNTEEINKFLEESFHEMKNETFQAIKMGLKPNVSMNCLNSLEEFKKGLDEKRIWAIRMIDSFGKIPSGLFSGSIVTLGDFDQCVETEAAGKFEGRYCVLSLLPGEKMILDYPDISTHLQLQVLGLATTICMPSTCSTSDVSYLISKVSEQTSKETFKIKVLRTVVKEGYSWTKGEKVVVATILAIVLLECFATFFDLRLKASHLDELTPSRKLLLCFSYHSNLIRLLKKEGNADSVKIFHGIKVLTIIWIIFGHTASFNTDFTSRKFHFKKLLNIFSFQIIWNAFPAVDTFFFISGFLVLYTYIKMNTPSINFFVFVLHRYFRMMLSTFFIYSFVLFIIKSNSGPIWEIIFSSVIDDCKEFWWKNMLCINSFSGPREQCIGWTWYIATDLQLYISSYFILLIYKRNPERAILILKFLVTASVIFVAVDTYYYDLPPVIFYRDVNLSKLEYYMKKVHFSSLNHVSPYGIGMITGYIIATKKTINLTKVKIFFGSLSSTVIGVGVVYVSYIWNNGHNPTALESVLYCSLNRIFWSLMLFWVIYITLNNKGGIVTSILSWNGFVVFGRLTFTVYLLHPIIILTFPGKSRELWSTDKINLIICAIFSTVQTFAYSFVLCLVYESPLTAMLSLLMSPRKSKRDLMKTKEDIRNSV